MMTPERWQDIDQLFHTALERDPAERAAFLDQACDGDEELRREVSTLLAADAKADSVKQALPAEVAAEMLTEDQTRQIIGQQIGHYKILSQLGVGGMGEVYLAQDTRLGRKVALKLLKLTILQDAGRVRRFERESRAASALNHPNILTIHEISENGQLHFIATEFVEGQTLRQRLNAGRMTLQETFEVAIQVASALNAAHAAGIIHRDIKPENVMVRPDGLVKVLDFGLAKLTERHAATVDDRAAAAAMSATDPGVVMGTVAYMSPEQARGLEVDARSDIFSLGVVLYEMIAGWAPFTGATPSDVMAAILTAELAPVSRFLPVTPELEQIVNLCLAKDREQRYQTIGEVTADLKAVRRRYESGHVEIVERQRFKPRKALWKPIAALFSCLVMAMILVLARDYFKPTKTPRPEKMTRLISTGDCFMATISPNGKYVAYVVNNAGLQGLRVAQLATNGETQIAPLAQVDYLGVTFSIDSDYLYYVKDDASSKNADWRKAALYRAPTIGGPSIKLIERLNSPISFSPDGRQFAFVREYTGEGVSALMVSNLDGAGERRLAERKLPYYFDYPAWSPDGEIIACTATGYSGPTRLNFFDMRGRSVESAAASRAWKHIWKVQWLKSGDGVILSVGDPERNSVQLWRLSYPGGEANRITNSLSNYIDVSLAADSDTLVTIESGKKTRNAPIAISEQNSSIWTWSKSNASLTPQVVRAAGNYGRVSWTRDGRIVFSMNTGNRWNIWMMKADGSDPKQLTFDDCSDFHPAVSPDGRYIVFIRVRQDKGGSVWRMGIDDSKLKAITAEIHPDTPQCSPDGKWVIFTAPSAKKWSVLWKASIDGGAAAQLNDTISTYPSISPDGKLIACFYLDKQTNTQTQWMSIAILPFAGGEPLRIFDPPTTVNQSAGIHWTADGRALTYVDSRNGYSNIWSQSLDGGPPKPLTDFKGDPIFSFDWSPDGKQLTFLSGAVTSNIANSR